MLSYWFYRQLCPNTSVMETERYKATVYVCFNLAKDTSKVTI